jgi:hypothetical protein
LPKRCSPPALAALLRDVTKRFEETRALKRKLAEATKPTD